MEKTEIRAVINLHLKRMSASEIHDDMLKALTAVSLYMQHVGSENLSLVGTVLKVTKIRTTSNSNKGNVDLALQMVMQGRPILCYQIADMVFQKNVCTL